MLRYIKNDRTGGQGVERVSFAVILSVLCVWPAFAEVSSKELESYLTDIKTLDGQFQQYVDGYLPRTGSVVFERPKKFVWRYGDPEPQKLISTGSALYFIDENSEQVTTLPQDIALTKLMFGETVAFNSDVTKLESMTRQDGHVYVHIDVIDSETWQADIDALTLVFKEDPVNLVGLTTIDRLGNQVDLFFETLTVNKPVDRSVFKFTPPQYDRAD
jgi:outer membrane lipoprotein-sorting protein